jgi:phosphatidylglycerophosphatase A
MPETHFDENGRPGVPFLTRFIATGFFAGYSPIVPGTAGSLVGLVLYCIPGVENTAVLSALSAAVLLLGAAVSATMERHFGEDPQIVVIDEVVGMWISLLLLPKSIVLAAAAFVLFRVYDTIKPPPARQLERVRRGWGVMLDDVAAGVYANLSVRILMWVLPVLK